MTRQPVLCFIVTEQFLGAHQRPQTFICVGINVFYGVESGSLVIVCAMASEGLWRLQCTQQQRRCIEVLWHRTGGNAVLPVALAAWAVAARQCRDCNLNRCAYTAVPQAPVGVLGEVRSLLWACYDQHHAVKEVAMQLHTAQ